MLDTFFYLVSLFISMFLNFYNLNLVLCLHLAIKTLNVAAGLGAGPQVQRDPGLASEGVLRLCTLLSMPPLLTWPEPSGLLRLVIRREHHQHDFPQHQSQPDRRHLPSSRRRLWKSHAPSSGSVSWRWLRLKAATLNRYQFYYIIKLPELIFSIKVLK